MISALERNVVSDCDLVDRLKSRDQRSYVDLDTKYGNYIRSVVRGLSKGRANDAQIDDVQQDVMLRVFISIHTFKGSDVDGTAFKGWLNTVSRNAYLQNIKERQDVLRRKNTVSLDMIASKTEEDVSETLGWLIGHDESSSPDYKLRFEQAVDRVSVKLDYIEQHAPKLDTTYRDYNDAEMQRLSGSEITDIYKYLAGNSDEGKPHGTYRSRYATFNNHIRSAINALDCS